MKKLYIIFLLPMLVISCGDDFTTLSPISERNVQNFYETPGDFEVAITGAYDALQSNGTFGVNYILFLEMRADNGANGGGATGLAATLQQLDDFEEISTANELKTTWNQSYEGIARTNTIISRIEDIQFNNSNLKDQIKGEALFIRSLLYYNMAVIFGNIPEQFEEVTTPNVDINQVPASVIFDRITLDLEEAEDLLPEVAEGGRATKYAAAALLGRVYLQAGNPSAAEAPLRRVVDSQQYELLDDYAQLWGASNEGNIESIFEVQYISGGFGEGSSYTDMYTPNGVGGGVGGGVAPQNVTDDIVTQFDPLDERFEATLEPDGDGGYWVEKFDSSPSIAFDAPNNWIEIRYAEVLLNLAEAIGEGTEAYDLINEVRNRAELANIDGNTPGTFEEKLLQERRLEFAFENKRWPDLLRFGVAKSVMSNHLGISESDVTLLYPIPQGAIDVAPDEMSQNPEH